MTRGDVQSRTILVITINDDDTRIAPGHGSHDRHAGAERKRQEAQ
jgi:hypothetical protein